MDGTTRCPHCDTRFKIGITQLEAHQGMVRCGKCMQVFDARPDYLPDQPSPQLELVIAARSEDDAQPSVELGQQDQLQDGLVLGEFQLSPDSSGSEPDPAPHDDSLDFITPRPPIHQPVAEAAIKSAEDDTWDESIRHDAGDDDEEEDEEESDAPARRWLWALPAGALTLLLLAQAAYIYRAELAARQPALKPVLMQYCDLLGCKVGLPQSNELMSIESSSLEADPTTGRRITLKALLRNRASYTLAYPSLELTLNDSQDNPVARRIFTPGEYLSSKDKVESGLAANLEADIQLHLDTTDLNANGYRLALYYPAK